MTIDYLAHPFHPTAEKIVETVCRLVENDSPMFFRLMVHFQLSKMASMMRVSVHTPKDELIPVNMYCCNLAPSGFNKGKSTKLMERIVLARFRSTFFNVTLPNIEEENLAKEALRRADINGLDPDDMMKSVMSEYTNQGLIPFVFSEATSPAIKQLRTKLLMAGIGSINLEIDEIGRNLTGNGEALTTLLELYDLGEVNMKLTKNTKENKHVADLIGSTPTNLMVYGAPVALLDGSADEEAFFDLLATGYARRFMFSYDRKVDKSTLDEDDDVAYDALLKTATDPYLADMGIQFEQLAHQLNYGRAIELPVAVDRELFKYKRHCERLAREMTEQEELIATELQHRYFKALKLSGMYAFIDGTTEVTKNQLYAAIRLVEESGKSFNHLNNREPPHAKLAKYIAGVGYDLTYPQISDALPFFKGSKQVKEDMLTYAIAWGYKNNVVIKRSFNSGIDFFQGETLQPTDLNKMRLAYSDHVAFNYKNVEAPFADLHKLTQKPHLHWINHHLEGGHRQGDSIIQGFNMVVLDVDGGTQAKFAYDLLKEYQGLIYTTKRHTPQDNRFRLILPLNFFLKLNGPDYREFMSNLLEWIPFNVDTGTNQRSRKWLTHPGSCTYLPGTKLVDVMEFIPRTAKNDERKKLLSEESLSNLERWFLQNTADGNRSSQMVKYALMLVDQGKDFDEIRSAVYGLNSKLQDKLSDNEIKQTILVTASKALKKRSNP